MRRKDRRNGTERWHRWTAFVMNRRHGTPFHARAVRGSEPPRTVAADTAAAVCVLEEGELTGESLPAMA